MTKPLTPRDKIINRLAKAFWHWMETGEEHAAWSEYVDRLVALNAWDDDPGCDEDCPCHAFDLQWRIQQMQHRPK